MNAFIWTISILIIIDIIVKTIWLSTQNIPQRTPKDIGHDLIANIILAVWAAVLLSH